MAAIRHPVVIIGGGLTGLSAAIHLKHPYVLVEREKELGGLARTEKRNGYCFDITGHWLHLRDSGVESLVKKLLGPNLVEIQRVSRVYSNGTFVRYPFQGNLYGLPPNVIYECLSGYFQTLLNRDREPPRNFEQFIFHHFGAGIARHFMIPYNTKLWGVHPREITSAWCQRFVPIPTPEQVVAGAVGANPPELGYNIRFFYPRHGGIQTLSDALAARLDQKQVRLSSMAEEIDPEKQTVVIGGERISYRALISTMPLPLLVKALRNAPKEIIEAGAQLRAMPVRYLNVATRTPAPSKYHWVYVPEERLPFYRVGIFSNAVPSMAPPGCSSLYVELADRNSVQDEGETIRDVLSALVEVQAISSVDDVVFADLREIDFAYVIYDKNYEAALGCIAPYLESRHIYSRGRYGAWTYSAMEESLLVGQEVAQKVNEL
ncbi:MAG: FAD-dependent oxidoreductase [Pseudomonadota bacterium]